LTRRSEAYDAIVVGAGHNGLVCAAYLARGGLRTLLLEAREAVGGMADTAELWRGVRVPVLAHTVGRFLPAVARELRLKDHGLRLTQPEVRVFAPSRDGGGIALRGDAALTANALATNRLVGPADAERYVDVDTAARSLARALSQLFQRVPPDLTSPQLGDVLGSVRDTLVARSGGRAASANLLRTMPMAVRDLVAEWFDSDALRAVLGARGVLLTGLGPRMPGTAGVLLTEMAGTDSGLAGHAVFARGGPGALTAALAGAARAFGAEIRTDAKVAAVRRAGDVVAGVTLANGDEVDAPLVVSSLDPKSTMLNLVDPEAIGPRLSWRATNIRQQGQTAKVNFALGGLPHFPAAAADVRLLRGRIMLAPSMAALDEAARPAKYGKLPSEPLIEATIPTLMDPDLVNDKRAKRVKHVVSAIVQGIPFGADPDRLGDIATKSIDKYAPGFAGLVEARQVLAAQDIERTYGAQGGHPMHAEVGLDQWFAWRPLHGFGRYRMPLRGMYIAGSGAHPGGGVTGAPGKLAAQEILSDAKAGVIRVSR
jgi:phytoene dehydrogenase-like protein